MSRFKYIPQRYKTYNDALNGEEVNDNSLLDSEPIDVSITDTPLIKDTLIVYDDYKIPLNITEELLYALYDIRNKIEDMHKRINEINEILESTTRNYDSFENKVFGFNRYLHDYHTFDHSYRKFNVNSVKDNGDSVPLKNKDRYVDAEMEKLSEDKGFLNYIKELVYTETDIIEPLRDANLVKDIENKLDNYKTNYNKSLWNTREKEWTKLNNDSIIETKTKVDDMRNVITNMFGIPMVKSLNIIFKDGSKETITIKEGE